MGLACFAFGLLRPAILGRRDIMLDTKRLIYEACVLAILLYGCQIWVLTPQRLSLLERTVNDHLDAS